MATLKDIAKKANTSITTVSRVLNYDKSFNVSEELRRTIFDVATAFQYKIPRNRSRILTKKPLKIGIILWFDRKEEQDDPYYIQIRRGIETLALKSQIDTTVIYKENDEYQLDMLGKIDGLICIGKFSSAQIIRFQSLTSNIVFVDSSPDDSVFDSIIIDFNKAVEDILKFILQEGYMRIGYIGGVEYINKQLKLGDQRELIFREFLYKRNKLQTKHIHIGTFSVESGYRLMKKALSKNDYARVYFCANDSIAFGALRAIHEKGLQIPKDIGIVGFNDNPSSAYTFPPLTTMHVHTEFMGEQALYMLIERINGRLIPIKKIISTYLVKRESFK